MGPHLLGMNQWTLKVWDPNQILNWIYPLLDGMRGWISFVLRMDPLWIIRKNSWVQ